MSDKVYLCPSCGSGIAENESTCAVCRWGVGDSYYDEGEFTEEGTLNVPHCDVGECITRDSICPCLLHFSVKLGRVSVWCDPNRNLLTVQ